MSKPILPFDLVHPEASDMRLAVADTSTQAAAEACLMAACAGDRP